MVLQKQKITKKNYLAIERLKKVIYDNKDKEPDQIKDVILDEINSFRKGYQQVDDLTFVIIKNTEDAMEI